jgi:hypothetical protein
MDKRSASTIDTHFGGCATLIHPTFFLNLMGSDALRGNAIKGELRREYA